MPNLFPPPPTADLPLSLGRDLIVTFRNKVPGSDPVQYVDFPGGVDVRLQIGRGSSMVTSTGSVSGSEAICRIQSTEADKIKPGTFWRVVVSVSNGTGVPITDEVPLNGRVVRADGA